MADRMYQQIAEDLRRQIEAGELPPDAQLPTEMELREKYQASRNTVRDAVKVLIARGLVETRPGQGTFVAQEIVPLITALSGDPETASGGEGRTYIAEVTAGGAGQCPTLPRGWRSRMPTAWWPGNSSLPSPLRWSAAISSAGSTTLPGPFRPPSTRWTWLPGARLGWSRPAT